MKILLIGKNGQVGWELQRSLSTLGDVVAVDYFDKELCGDLTDLEGIAQTVRTVRPDVVVNAAAHTAVDKAESERGALRPAERQRGGGAGGRVGEAGCPDGALFHGLCV
jgi:dTDP-4-dehydrorhamnose reductase